MFPRIEFHYPVTIIGMDTHAKIIDFSLNGFYIETRQVDSLSKGQRVNLALKLPDEIKSILIKAQLVYLDERGFGCQFTELAPDAKAVLERCFDLHAGMLPID